MASIMKGFWLKLKQIITSSLEVTLLCDWIWESLDYMHSYEYLEGWYLCLVIVYYVKTGICHIIASYLYTGTHHTHLYMHTHANVHTHAHRHNTQPKLRTSTSFHLIGHAKHWKASTDSEEAWKGQDHLLDIIFVFCCGLWLVWHRGASGCLFSY